MRRRRQAMVLLHLLQLLPMLLHASAVGGPFLTAATSSSASACCDDAQQPTNQNDDEDKDQSADQSQHVDHRGPMLLSLLLLAVGCGGGAMMRMMPQLSAAARYDETTTSVRGSGGGGAFLLMASRICFGSATAAAARSVAKMVLGIGLVRSILLLVLHHDDETLDVSRAMITLAVLLLFFGFLYGFLAGAVVPRTQVVVYNRPDRAPDRVDYTGKLDDALWREIFSFDIPTNYRYRAAVSKDFWRMYTHTTAHPATTTTTTTTTTPVTSYEAAVQTIGTVEIWLQEGDFHDIACDTAARYGRLDVFIYLRWDRQCPWSATTCAVAARHGHLPILKWARTGGCPWDASTCAAAADHGHMNILQWAIREGCPWDDDTMLHLHRFMIRLWSLVVVRGRELEQLDDMVQHWKTGNATDREMLTSLVESYTTFETLVQQHKHRSAEFAEAGEAFATIRCHLTEPFFDVVGQHLPLLLLEDGAVSSSSVDDDEDTLQATTEDLLKTIVEHPRLANYQQMEEALRKAIATLEVQTRKIGQIVGEIAVLNEDYTTMRRFSTKVTNVLQKAVQRVSEIWPTYAKKLTLKSLDERRAYPQFDSNLNDTNTDLVALVFAGCPRLLALVREQQVLFSTIPEQYDHLRFQIGESCVSIAHQIDMVRLLLRFGQGQLINQSVHHHCYQLDTRRLRKMRKKRRRKRYRSDQARTSPNTN